MFLKYFRMVMVINALSAFIFTDAMQNPQKFSLDKTFGKDGIVTTDFGMHSGTYNKVVPSIHTKIQPDGKIIVVGDAFKNYGSSITNPESAIALARYMKNGLLDTYFGKNGKVIVPIPYSYGIDLALQADGKIVIAGRIFDREDHYTLGDAAVLRLNQDGSLDESFGENGIVRDSNDGLHWSNFFRVAVCDDGDIIACGNKGLNKPGNMLDHCSFYLKRFKKNGTLDETFGNRGYIEPVLKVSNYTKSRVEGREADESYAVMIQPGGKIIAVGRIEDASQIDDLNNITNSVDCAIMRFEKSGELDSSFGLDNNGMVVTSVSKRANYFVDCLVQPDSKILALGISRNTQTDKDEFLMVRYLENGSLDHSFGDHGIVMASLGDEHAHAKNIVLQNDGKILVTGHAILEGKKKFTVVRYTPDGDLDTTFGSNNGLLVTSLGDYDDRSFALALQDDAKLIIAGDSFDGTQLNFALVRYNVFE